MSRQSINQGRRQLLQAGTLLGSAALLAPGSLLAQSRRVYHPGLQLYTLRNEMAGDFEGTLARVASLGFREMEFAGYFNRSAAQVRRILDDNGLVSPAAHIQMTAVRNNLQAEIEWANTLGQRYIVVPILAPNERTLDDYRRHADTLNRAGEACRAAGLKMGYHNHSFEFELTDGQVPYDVLLQETDPALVDFELDLYWITNAGVDPLPYFQRYPGRFTMLHVKDMGSDGSMVDVGSGQIDFEGLFAQRDEAGFEHFFVEHDNPGDGIRSISNSIRALQAMRF